MPLISLTLATSRKHRLGDNHISREYISSGTE